MENQQKIIAIAAIGKNKELGYKNKLLWHLPEDLKNFKKLTLGHPIIMGSKTYNSLPKKPLPGRENIVMTLGDENFPGAFVARSPKEALDIANKSNGADKIFIIGGGQIYKIMLPYCNELYLTLVDDAPQADVFFPDYENDFALKQISEPKTENSITYRFAKFVRNNQ